MARPKVFIDGEHGTTGLEIRERLMARTDIELVSLPVEQRKNARAKLDVLNRVNLVILCLPDDAARETVALAGEGCPSCGKPLRIVRVIEIGNIFKLGTTYSVPLGAMYLDEGGKQQPIVMGSYGIGPARIAAAAVEQRHDADGIVWPWAIAPFHVHLVPVAVKDAAQMAAAEEIYRDLRAAGFDVLMDDREERAGVKFKDADLLGIPIRVTVGNALAKEGVVELRQRSTRTDRRVPRDQVVAAVQEMAKTIS